MDRSLYHYRAVVVGVYDGDTITVDIDLGCSIWLRKEKVRLSGLNAPELTGLTREAGLATKNYLAEMLLGKPIFLRTYKDKREKYGRYLGDIWVEQDGAWVNVNAQMIASGHAVPYMTME